MSSPTQNLNQILAAAIANHQAGRLADAEAGYRRVLQANPLQFDALHLTGLIALQVGRFDLAADYIRKAVSIFGGRADAFCNLGNALKALGKSDEAAAAYQKAIAVDPQSPIAHINLGVVLSEQGKLDEAIQSYLTAISHEPQIAEAHCNLGNAYRDKGQSVEAILSYQRAVELKPDLYEARINLANAYLGSGAIDKAIVGFEEAIAVRPELPEGYVNLSNALRADARFEDAAAACRKAIELNPDYADAHNNLGVALFNCKKSDDAITAYRRAIALQPTYAAAYANMGVAFREQGQLDEAVAAFRDAVTIKPDYTDAHSNLLCTLRFHPDFSADAIAQEHALWNRQHVEPLRRTIKRFSNDRSPDRPLRIGYASGDFRNHVVGRNILPLLREHDRSQFEIYCYSGVTRPDSFTDRFRTLACHWRDIRRMTDEQSAQMIREDQIDILVDLALHMSGDRLLVFARKPAPIQVGFAGYPASTGLATMDYRLTDPYLEPPGVDDPAYADKSIRLPDSFWCYDAEGMETDLLPVPGPLPAIANGFITFGCLNNNSKINPMMLAKWARVMNAVSDSRLLMLAPEGSFRDRTTDFLAKAGIDPKRVRYALICPREDYFRLYQQIDIGLDALPYNGHTTSLDSFWMGVPVVTLVGQTVVGRAGLSTLSNLGLQELAADTEDQFVQIATDLARDLPRLEILRGSMRQRMLATPLMDSKRFTRNIEAAYRGMWRVWCRHEALE